MESYNLVIEKSKESTLFEGYGYTYVMNNPLLFTDPSGYMPQWVQDEYDEYYRNGGGGSFNYFAGYDPKTGKYDPYHNYRAFNNKFSDAGNVGRFSRNPGPIDIYHDQESGESYYIYQSALNGLAYYERDVDFGYFESYEKDNYIEGYSVNGIRKQIKESGVRYISDILIF